ncbi:MAG: hypothetical protein HUJ98_08635, partial [Bacteroidaceae bacterium]|nr:hypothetical protein [Bacteroidaceae bacterium]
SDNLAHDFLDILCSEVQPSLFAKDINFPEWKEYVGSRITSPLMNKLQSAVEKAKSSKGKGATARLQAGSKLMNDTKAALAELRQHLSSSDLQYQMIADKVGLEILQCGIDYYNDSEEHDAAQKAMKLQSFAQSIVVGQMAKDRCKENVDILKKIIAELPPSEVFAEDRAIKEELRKFCDLPDKISHSVTLLNKTKPHLQSIKTKLGASNSYYLKISTQVVGNALHNIIEEVNSVQNDPTFQMSMILDKRAALSSLQTVLRSAWNATIIMDSFDMETDFKANRYNANRRTLSKMCNDVGVSTYGSPSPTYSGTTTSSSSSSNDDTNWGCIIFVITVAIIALMSMCS